MIKSTLSIMFVGLVSAPAFAGNFCGTIATVYTQKQGQEILVSVSPEVGNLGSVFQIGRDQDNALRIILASLGNSKIKVCLHGNQIKDGSVGSYSEPTSFEDVTLQY